MAGALLATAVVIAPGGTHASADGPIAEFRDDFDGPALDAGWTIRDGYADAHPEDTADHASYTVADGHLAIDVPAGEEHNMWWLEHAQLVRPYLGSGVYEVKVDSPFTGDQQFGIVFESAPGTFLLFMLYAHGQVMGYVEQFHQLDGYLHKDTLVGFNTGVPVPSTGPYYVRVTVDDDADPTLRTWHFQWSRDGGNWHTGAQGVLEGPEEENNAGAIQSVSLFAGNQPSAFSGYEARFDHFYATAAPVPPAIVAPVVETSAYAGTAVLDWNQVFPDDSYVVSRSTSESGPFTVVGTVDEPHFVDQDVVDGTTYYYTVAVTRDGTTGAPSAPAAATPHATGLEHLPTDGLVTALLAGELELADGAPVTRWDSVTPTPLTATGGGSQAPTFAASGIGGQPAVRFDGVDDFLSLGTGFDDFTAGMSMFVVAKPRTLQPGMKMVLLGNGAAAGLLSLGRSGTTSGMQYVTTNAGGSFGWFETSTGLVAGQAAVYSVSQGGGAVGASVPSSISRNGAVIGSGQVYVPPVTPRSGNSIGNSYWADGKFDGDIAEVLIYDRQLSASEAAAVNDYLLAKYGVVTPPAAPSGLVASPGDGAVSLSWSAVSGASAYRVSRSVSGAGSFAQIAEVTGAAHVDTTVTNGTTYQYRVTAVGAGGQSAPSATVTATPEAPLPLPQGVPLDGLVLSLDGGTLSVADGAPVAMWSDNSGVGPDAVASGSSRPVLVDSAIGGRPAVRFDGADDFLSLGAGFEDFTDGMSMFVVAKPSTLRSGMKMVVLGNGPSGSIGLGRSGSSSSLQYLTSTAGGSFSWFETSAGLTAGEPAVYSVSQGSGAVGASVPASVSRNGVGIGAGQVAVPPVGTRSHNYIGNSYWADGMFDGDIAEVLVYDRQLTPAEAAAVNDHLTDKYGLG